MWPRNYLSLTTNQRTSTQRFRANWLRIRNKLPVTTIEVRGTSKSIGRYKDVYTEHNSQHQQRTIPEAPLSLDANLLVICVCRVPNTQYTATWYPSAYDMLCGGGVIGPRFKLRNHINKLYTFAITSPGRNSYLL